jgi:hypothetical protein
MHGQGQSEAPKGLGKGAFTVKKSGYELNLGRRTSRILAHQISEDTAS